jgi:hypothetical protein
MEAMRGRTVLAAKLAAYLAFKQIADCAALRLLKVF